MEIILNKLLAHFPWLEVVIRVFYWKTKIGNYLISKLSKNISHENEKIKKNGCLNDLRCHLIELGIKKDDTLIIHSSMSKLAYFNATPDDIVDCLIDIVGVNGNIIMPAIPVFRKQPKPFNRFDIKNYNNISIYNLQKTKIWTGALPYCLSKRAGAIKSRSPLNTMVAFGKDAKKIISNDMFTSQSLPCGPNSPLYNAIFYNAKMLFLGVREVHSMTFIHTVEDINTNWPVGDWYWKRKFNVIDNDYNKIFTLRERNPFWSLFYAEGKFEKDLLDNDLLSRCSNSSINISVAETKSVFDFLNKNKIKNTTYPFYIPFWFKNNVKKNN